MPALSIALPMMPSNASISLTKCPLPKPPIAGLHDISPILSLSIVINNVLHPILLLAAVASIPE